jgi:hypothetical protein
VSEQIGPGAAPASLERRVHALEERVTALGDAIRLLARGQEDIPTIEPGQGQAAQAARRANDLLHNRPGRAAIRPWPGPRAAPGCRHLIDHCVALRSLGLGSNQRGG